MRLKILSPVQHGEDRLLPGVTAQIPDQQALELIKVGSAEPLCQKGRHLAAQQAAEALAAKARHDLYMAEVNDKATPKGPEFIGFPRR